MDLHLIHEVTSPQAFEVLRSGPGGPRPTAPWPRWITRPHDTPDALGKYAFADAQGAQVEKLVQNCDAFGIRCTPSAAPIRASCT